MSSFLVTGSEGQLGQCFKAVAKEFTDHQLIFARKAEADLTVPKTFHNIYQTHPFDGIINCAAYTQVDQAEEESLLANRLNVEGIKNIIDFAEEKSLSIIHFSTDYVYDGSTTKPYKEDALIQPVNNYGYSKYQGEEILKKASCPHTFLDVQPIWEKFRENYFEIKSSKKIYSSCK